MKRKYRNRLLSYEQLDSKVMPSSLLLVMAGDGTSTESPLSTTSPSDQGDSTRADSGHYDTDQLLQFVADNTLGVEQVNRVALPASEAQCVAADEMMSKMGTDATGFFVLRFNSQGTEL